MTRASLCLILLSITITAVAQIVLKAGMTGAAVQRAMLGAFGVRTVAMVIFDPLVLGGLVLYFVAAIVWLIVLSRVQVSLAYPFVALGFPMTAVFGCLFLNETLTPTRMAAILLICVGVILLART